MGSDVGPIIVITSGARLNGSARLQFVANLVLAYKADYLIKEVFFLFLFWELINQLCQAKKLSRFNVRLQ